MMGGLALNFIGTIIAILRAQLKTENRLTHLETMVSVIMRDYHNNCPVRRDDAPLRG